MAIFYDTHAHLTDEAFLADLEAVLDRARHVGIQKIVVIGTDLEDSQRCIQLAERYLEVYAVVGWHPNEALRAPGDLRPVLRNLARHPKVVALGETGMDAFRLPPDETRRALTLERQELLFRQHLEVAAETGLSCVVHQRAIFDRALAIYAEYAAHVRAVFHCFAEGSEALHRLLALGGIVSFTGLVTFRNGEAVRQTVTATPLDALMLETDAPYLAPEPHRGRRCEPFHLIETAKAVAAVKGISLEELSRTTCQVAERFFPRLRPVS
ncbi:MAG: TatD family hydrolase [Verrucomicrobiota bacterium]|nr:TatD family hydrolase [Limisphaera sp.]MDW8380644.1 TatD family hydrolase [Verrucomicrobiota bacterium]